MSISSDFQQNRSDFVWISRKTCFFHDFWWFFPVSSKEAKCHFLLILIFLPFLIFFPSYILKSKMSFSPDFQQNKSVFVWISMKTYFYHDSDDFFQCHQKKQTVIFSWFPAKSILFYLNQHEKMCSFYDFWKFFPVISKKTKCYFLLISSRIDLFLSESAWKHTLITISDDFFQCHQKRQIVIFSWFPAESILFCLNQHVKMLFYDFWWFFLVL